MRKTITSQCLLIVVTTLALLGMISAPASAKSSKHAKQPPSIASAQVTANAIDLLPDTGRTSRAPPIRSKTMKETRSSCTPAGEPSRFAGIRK